MKALWLATVLWLAAGIEAASNCRWGPSYWCQSREAAKECQQTRYCQDNVWKGTGFSTEKGSGGTECTICQLVVQVIDSKLKDNATEEEIEAAIDKACDELGPLKSVCTGLVDEYFPQIWQLLMTKLDPSLVCSEIGLCNSTAHGTDRKASLRKTKGTGVSTEKIRGAIECTICQTLVKVASEELGKNATEQEAEKIVEQACNYLGGLAGTCTSLVEQYFPMIWKLLTDEVDPQTVCSDIHLCSSKARKTYRTASLQMPKVGGAPRSVSGAVECQICKTGVNMAFRVVDENSTEEVVKDAVLLACGYMGGFAEVCRAMIDKEWDEIYSQIMSFIDQPDKLCELIKMCTTGKSKSLLKQQMPQAGVCDLCKLVTTFLKPYVDSNTTEDEVKNAIESVCALLPGGLGAECKSLIDEYFPQIWDLVKQEVDGDEICVQLNLCNSTKTTQLVKKVQEMPRATACDLCKLVTNYIKPFVDSNTTKQEVKGGLDEVCGILPGSLGSECSSLVDQYFDTIWSLVEQEVDTGEVCMQLGLCNSTKTTQLAKKVLKAPRADLCGVCKLVCTFLKPYVDSNTTEQQVKSDVEQLCKILPGGLASECTQLIDQYFDTIWSLLKGEVDSDDICDQLKLCNSAKTKLAATSKLQKVSVKGFECELCQLVSKELKTLMDKNNTETEVQDDLKRLCSIVPGSLGSNCTKMVNQYFMLGWVVMKQMVDAGSMCGYIKMCDSTSSHAITYLKTTQVGDNECSVCKMVVETVQNVMSSGKTLDEAEKLMEEVCPYMVGFSAQCKQIIEMYLPEIWKFLEDKLDPSAVCAAIKLCPSSVQLSVQPKLQKSSVKGFIECELCDLIMKELVPLVSSNKSEQEIKTALDKFCEVLPIGKKYSNECVSFVDKYTDEIIQIITSGVDPKEICTMIHLCSSGTRQQLHMAGGMECTVCKDVLTVAKDIIGSSTAESEIAKVLENVCSIVSPGIKSECVNFISTFGPELIQLLAKAIEPDVICREIKLCTASSVMEPWSKLARKY